MNAGTTLQSAGAAASPPREEIRGALAGVWQRCHPVVFRRAEAVELAARELAAHPDDPAQVKAGRDEAHKLAGVLGTFGLQRGTELARDLEQHLGSQADGEALRLQRVAAELCVLVEQAAS